MEHKFIQDRCLFQDNTVTFVYQCIIKVQSQNYFLLFTYGSIYDPYAQT